MVEKWLKNKRNPRSQRVERPRTQAPVYIT